MMKAFQIIIFLGLFALMPVSSSVLFGQNGITRIHISGTEIIVEIDRREAGPLTDSICRSFGLSFPDIDSLWHEAGERDICSEDGWCVQQLTDRRVVLFKPVNTMEGNINWLEGPVMVDEEWMGGANGSQWIQPEIGVNDPELTTVMQAGDKTRFTLPGHQNAARVFLAGTFNNWSTLATPMVRSDSGWSATMPLPPGKYWYKFVVDGEWIHDNSNALTEPDGHGGMNSTYFVTNHIFRLDGFQNARRVYLSGSFNNWSKRDLAMQPTSGGWELPVFLHQGTHTYKYVVDKRWIADPANPRFRPDGEGNMNSVVSIGDTLYFHLNNYEAAREVAVTGCFNNWNEKELAMTRNDTGWTLPYVLAPGNYEYKFVVDGQWITDPGNRHTTGTGEYTNSVLAIGPNHTFRLRGFPQADHVAVSGSFNGWSDTGYRMRRENGEWLIPLHLDPGKHTYKLVVDGQWMIDPGNELYEENEFGTGNSVLWIEPLPPGE